MLGKVLGSKSSGSLQCLIRLLMRFGSLTVSHSRIHIMCIYTHIYICIRVHKIHISHKDMIRLCFVLSMGEGCLRHGALIDSLKEQ